MVPLSFLGFLGFFAGGADDVAFSLSLPPSSFSSPATCCAAFALVLRVRGLLDGPAVSPVPSWTSSVVFMEVAFRFLLALVGRGVPYVPVGSSPSGVAVWENVPRVTVIGDAVHR